MCDWGAVVQVVGYLFSNKGGKIFNQPFYLFNFVPTQVLSFTHPVSFHSAETFESLLGCLKMDDEKVAEAALQIFKNTGSKMEESFPHIKSYVSSQDYSFFFFFLLNFSSIGIKSNRSHIAASLHSL